MPSLPPLQLGIPPLPKSIKKSVSQLPIAGIPMPRPIFYLTCASSLNTFLILPVSFLDYGGFSLFVTPPMAIFTLLYHATVFVVSQRPRKKDRPTYYSTMILFTFFLNIGWIIAVVTTALVLFTPNHDFAPIKLKAQGLPVSEVGQYFQFAATILECMLILAIGVKGLMIANEEGEPDSWRPKALETPTLEEEIKVRHPSVNLASLLFAEGKVDSMVFEDIQFDDTQTESARPIQELPRLDEAILEEKIHSAV